MLKPEQNDLVCRSGPGTPLGALFRRYWQPVALESDIPEDAPLPVAALHQHFVLFRDAEGRPGLLDMYCAHRGADLSYGRLEHGGLRCLYHGWVWDVGGRCLQQPAEPPGREFCDKVRQRSYPLRVQGGVVFAYLGDDEPPAFPEWDALTAPPENRFMVRSRERCNWLQGLEGDIDPYHLSFLHLALEGEKKNLNAANGGRNYEFFTRGTARMEVERTDFGVRIYAMRDLGEESYIRISNYVCPNLAIVAGGQENDGYMALWHVPIDDHSHFKYQLFYRRTGPVDRAREAPLAVMQWDPKHPDRLPERNRENRWLQDREQMKNGWFAGIGPSFGLHDNWATEAMGPLFDRSKEHLGHGDRGVVAARQTLLNALDRPEADLPFRVQDPAAMKRMIAQIVCAALISPDKNRYKEVFRERHLEALAQVEQSG
jgi:phenylpropionate dioxygenase-like ring-hydroxylating dioxygenase large terminal subunit